MNAGQAARLGVAAEWERLQPMVALRHDASYLAQHTTHHTDCGCLSEAAADLIDALAARLEEGLPRLVVPEWSEAFEEGGLNPLEQFVYDNEPAGAKDEAEFRAGLQALLDWATGFAARDREQPSEEDR